MRSRFFVLICMSFFLLISCVSSQKFKAEQAKNEDLNQSYVQVQQTLKECSVSKDEALHKNADLQKENEHLKEQVAYLKENNTQALRQLQELSVLSASQAESIKKSLDNIGSKDLYIQELQSAVSRRDSLNLTLVMNLKGVIGNLNDEDINIKIDKGVVYIDISDKLLFQSGKYEVTPQAKTVLGKVAQVLKNQPDMEYMVEGHTDNVPYRSGVLLDNWDLSVKRATAVVRILQNEYELDPARLMAAGRSEYNPITDNATAESRAINRRTRIVILPQLDQFFKLLEPKS
ncbi:MAG: OmpA family protein [Chitinophagaceae bacterium]|nr:OmpA family protein [Chitinophagaceae bacterium]